MINCVAIDDEPIALSILAEHCRRLGGINLRTYLSAADGMADIGRTHPDLVLMDIELNGHNGVELARQLPEGTQLIFTTAFGEYALDGFEVDAVDFLHKPIFYERFERGINKAMKMLEVRDLHRRRGDEDATLTLNSEYKKVVINLADILYVEAMDNYVKVVRRGQPIVISQIPLKEVEALLPQHRFMRVHRSYVVNLDCVTAFTNRSVVFGDTGRTVPVGRTYLAEFTRRYGNK